MMEEKMRFGGLEEQFSQITDNKIPFLQMLHECIEPTTEPPNQTLQSLLQIQTLEPESSSLTIKRDPDQDPAATRVLKEKRKRKRTRAPKDKEEVEKQRMTHIAVERNRRRQMNQHLNSLRSLMPPSFLNRGDQASIVGGAIDFIKELEQLLQSMEGEKDKEGARACSVSTSSEDGFTARFGGGETTEVESTVIESHVRLKVRCKRGKGQILKAIVSIEELKLSILHLTISSSSSHFFFYSFNLKIEEGCKLGSADEIATAVHEIFEANQNQR